MFSFLAVTGPRFDLAGLGPALHSDGDYIRVAENALANGAKRQHADGRFIGWIPSVELALGKFTALAQAQDGSSLALCLLAARSLRKELFHWEGGRYRDRLPAQLGPFWATLGQAPSPPGILDTPRARLADYVAAGRLEDSIDAARSIEAAAPLLWRDAVATGQVIAFELQGSSFGLLRPEIAVQVLCCHPLERSRRTIEVLLTGEFAPSILRDGDAPTPSAAPPSRKGQGSFARWDEKICDAAQALLDAGKATSNAHAVRMALDGYEGDIQGRGSIESTEKRIAVRLGARQRGEA